MINFKFVINYSAYFNYNRLYSFQDLINLFILIGGRGIGKTTGVLIKSIQNFNKRGEQFAYVRRYVAELKESKNVLDTITNDSYVEGSKDKFLYKEKGSKKIIGFGLALSVQAKYKSGIDFSKVTTIIFDEYTIMRSARVRYLPDEMTAFFELVSTIVRTRKNYKIFIIGNNNDLFNPIIEYFNINVKQSPYIDKERGIYFEYCETKKELLEMEKETPLYKLTKGTTYHDYHYSNEVLVTSTCRLGVKKPSDILLCRMLFNNKTLNVYIDRKGLFFIEYRDKVIKDSLTYIIMENNVYNVYYCRLFKNNDIGIGLINAYFMDNVEYQNNNCYSILTDFMDKVG